MNMEDKDVDLELQLGSTNYSSGAGAIASADSRVYMAFRAPDPLSELVWSPNNGLSLKCAHADKNPFRWNTGPNSNKGTREIGAVDQGQLPTSQAMHDVNDAFSSKFTSVMPSRSHPAPMLGLSHDQLDHKSNSTPEEGAGTSGDALRMKHFRDSGTDNVCSWQNGQVADIAEFGKSIAGLSTLADKTGNCKVGKAMNCLFPTKFIRKTNDSDIKFNASSPSMVGLDNVDHCEPLASKISKVNLEPQKKWADEGTSATGELNEMKISTPYPVLAAPPTAKLQESSAENDMCHLTVNDACSLAEKKHMTETYPSGEGSLIDTRICLYQKKGKGKASSDEGIYGRASNDEDDDHESVKSHNSAEQFSKGIKRCSYDSELIIGTKRLKKHHGNPGLESFVIPDSSFTNWVSNMVKGMADTDREDSLSLALALPCPDNVYSKDPEESFYCNKRHDSPGLDRGFQAVFRSMYCAEKGNHSGKSPVDGKTLLENIPRSCRENNASGILACSEHDGAIQSDSDGKRTDGAADKTAPQVGLGLNDVSEKSNLHTSPWITRFCKEIAGKTDECSICFPEANLDGSRVINAVPIDQKSSGNDFTDCQIYACQKWIQRFTASAEASVDPKSTNEQSMMIKLPVTKFRSSEAMASVFARRLDALKHVSPSMRKNNSMYSIRCFFCGSGHYLSECPNVTETELEDLLVKTASSVGTMDESTCLCIRCFQSGHWAISCPLAPSSGDCRPEREPKASIISHYTAFRLELCAGNGSRASYHQKEEDGKLVSVDQTTWNLDSLLSKKLAASSEIRTSAAALIRGSEKDNQNHPHDIDTIPTPPLEICHAIRNLRLSRGDILRCMNSNLSVSHLKGFFLRLRLGKLESGRQGVGESGYYVACIAGDDAREYNVSESKRSILVDVGGGLKSSVESQYVSNHDFLEDEIKAWWRRTVESGCRVPSLMELNSKFNDRKKSLGF